MHACGIRTVRGGGGGAWSTLRQESTVILLAVQLAVQNF